MLYLKGFTDAYGMGQILLCILFIYLFCSDCLKKVKRIRFYAQLSHTLLLPFLLKQQQVLTSLFTTRAVTRAYLSNNTVCSHVT